MSTPRIIFIAAALVAAVFPAPAMSQAHVAAGIAYEETPRPGGLPDDMQPLPGVRLRFLSISAIDGFRIAAGFASGCHSAAAIRNPSIALIDRNRSPTPGSGCMSSGSPPGRGVSS